MCKVSVIMPAYNAEKYIRESIESVMEQSYPNWELIIVNDGSKDNTPKIIEGYEETYAHKIKVFHHECNKGTAEALSTALSHTKGEYICWLSADDLYEKNFIDTLFNFLEDNHEYGGCFCRYSVINESSDLQSEWKSFNYVNELMDTNSRQPYYRLITESNAFNGCCFMGRSEIFKKAGAFSSKYRYAHDYEYWLRVCSDTCVGFINKALVRSREYDGQITRLGRNEVDALQVFYDFITSNSDLVIRLFSKAGINDSSEGVFECFERRIQKYALENKELDKLYEVLMNYLHNKSVPFFLCDKQWDILLREIQVVKNLKDFCADGIFCPYGDKGYLSGICRQNDLDGLVLNKQAVRFERYASEEDGIRFFKGLERDNSLYWVEMEPEEMKQLENDSEYFCEMIHENLNLRIGFTEYMYFMPEWQMKIREKKIHRCKYNIWKSLMREIIGENIETIY